MVVIWNFCFKAIDKGSTLRAYSHNNIIAKLQPTIAEKTMSGVSFVAQVFNKAQ